MSLANIAKLFYRMDHEQEVKVAVDAIVSKYNSPEYENVNREDIIVSELIPLGESFGLGFTLDEFMLYLSDPSLQKLYETARVVGGSPDDPDFGKRIAASKATKFIVNDAVSSADNYYNDNYVSDQEFGGTYSVDE